MLRDNFAANQPEEQTPVRSKEGILLTKEDEVKKRWKKHFAEVLNRPPPTRSELESEACEPLKIETGPVTHAEIRTAIKQMKNGKAWWCRWHDNRADESRP